MDESKSDSTEDYSFSFELNNPNALSIVNALIESINKLDTEIKSVRFEVKSEEPFNKNLIPIDNEIEDKFDYDITEQTTTIFAPKSNEFRISSILVHENEPLSTSEVETLLKNTEWALEQDIISKTFQTLKNEEKVEVIEDAGEKKYYLTEIAEKELKESEEQIKNSEKYKIYDDVVKSLDYECDICGQKFETGGGLGSHKYFKHSEDKDEQRKLQETEDSEFQSQESEVQPQDSAIIKPGTNKFYSASVLHATAKPVVPKDIESRLEGTDWETKRSTISATLGQLYKEDIVDREKRRSERGKPYEYTLTEEGKELFSEVLESMGEDTLTFEDVVEGKLKEEVSKQKFTSDPKQESTSDSQQDADKSESEDSTTTKKENSTESNSDIKIESKGLKAGPKQNVKHSKDRTNKSTAKNKIPEPQPYDNAPFISRNDFTVQEGDFIRYVKEDNIIYQGTVLRGKPVEHGFNYYHGQDDDFVVKLDFDNGKHIAEQKIQQEDSITIMKAKGRTTFGRNVETVSPAEIIAISPKHDYDWYKFKESWNLQTNEYFYNEEES